MERGRPSQVGTLRNAREWADVFQAWGISLAGYGFFSASLSSKSRQSKLKSASGDTAASLALLMLPSGFSEKVIKASSMVRSRQCALNVSYCQCRGSPLLDGSVGAQIGWLIGSGPERLAKTFTPDGIEMNGEWKPCEC